MVDERVMQIADAVLEVQVPSRDDVLYLLGFGCYSVEAAYVNARARQLGMRASGGIGLIEAQIGVDALPCPENCRYCSFAAVNSGIGDDAPAIVALDDIVASARLFDAHNVSLISLMATAALPFDRYLEMVAAVREAVAPDMAILANTRDLSLEDARALKEAGATMAYHACRCGEGYVTDIEVERRHQTMRNIRSAGLPLMNGIEPLWEEVPCEELTDRICEIPDFDPFATGACGLSGLDGSELARLAALRGETVTPSPTARVKYVGAIVRLVCGERVPFGGVGGAIWVDAGTDPRGRNKGSDEAWLARDIRVARRTLEKDGWTVPDRPPF